MNDETTLEVKVGGNWRGHACLAVATGLAACFWASLVFQAVIVRADAVTRVSIVLILLLQALLDAGVALFFAMCAAARRDAARGDDGDDLS